MEIRKAVESEAATLSALAIRSKASWGYPAQVLEGWLTDLTVSATQIREQATFVAVMDGELMGFYSLRRTGRSCELDHLWVVPEYMRRGVGRSLLAHAMETALRSGATEILVDADPHAERFYLDHGAQRRGAVPAQIPGQPDRERPQLAFRLPPCALRRVEDPAGP